MLRRSLRWGAPLLLLVLLLLSTAVPGAPAAPLAQACAPRPPVSVVAAPAAPAARAGPPRQPVSGVPPRAEPGGVQVAVPEAGAGNTLQHLRFEPATNARVEVDGRVRTPPFTLDLPAGTTTKSFVVVQV